MAIVDLHGPGDDCARNAALLPQNLTRRIPFQQADDAMNIVCGTPGCSDRVNNFAVQCLPVSDVNCCDIWCTLTAKHKNSGG